MKGNSLQRSILIHEFYFSQRKRFIPISRKRFLEYFEFSPSYIGNYNHRSVLYGTLINKRDVR